MKKAQDLLEKSILLIDSYYIYLVFSPIDFKKKKFYLCDKFHFQVDEIACISPEMELRTKCITVQTKEMELRTTCVTVQTKVMLLSR